ncbi:hypothetical protein COY27_01165 [Candidatus Woesearchaeota archaeon CG_4_10_14_0_2_um_filter_33_13]|nr:MAG: hypothetical protein COY27_01165 [Candidatus Woesearchaeota archaeon CG_4_10_14_0_2_um_filter_33_13]
MYRTGKDNKKALLKASGHQIAFFESEYLAHRCAELLNMQETNTALKNYNGVIAYYISETKHNGEYIISDYKGKFVCRIENFQIEIAQEIQKLLSCDIIFNLSMEELKKVTKVKTKYKITVEEQINGDKTYTLYKDTWFEDNTDIRLVLSTGLIIVLFLISIYRYNIFSIIAFFIAMFVCLLGCYWRITERYEKQTLPVGQEYTKSLELVKQHIELLNQRTIKEQLKKLLLSKQRKKEIYL